MASKKLIWTILLEPLSKIWHGPNMKISLANKKIFEESLVNLLPEASSIEVKDVSGGSGAIYEIYVESPQFLGLSILDQHRAVVNALGEQIKLVHGVRIVTKACPIDEELIFE